MLRNTRFEPGLAQRIRHHPNHSTKRPRSLPIIHTNLWHLVGNTLAENKNTPLWHLSISREIARDGRARERECGSENHIL